MPRRFRALRAVSITFVVVGVMATAWFVYGDTLGGRSLVLCSDPEDFACSGHYVHGVANEVWTVLVVALGGVGLLVTRSGGSRR